MKILCDIIKKTALVLIVAVIASTILSSNLAFGADVYNRLMNGDSQQTALLLVELGEVDKSMETSSKVKVLRCVNGTIDTRSTRLNKIDNSNGEFSSGDKVLVSVSKRFYGGYDVYLFMKEVSLSDIGVVTFAEEEYTPDLFALEWYVNTGDKDFVFEGNDSNTVAKVYVNKKSDSDVGSVEKLLIYSETEDGKIDVERLSEPCLTRNNDVAIQEKFYNKHKTILIIICSAILVALVIFRIWFGVYWKKKNTPTNSITEQ